MLMTVQRDNRAINHMDPNTKWVHFRLEAWGRWARENAAEGMGWPAVTVLGRVIEQGADGAGQSGRPPIHMPDEIAHVDAAVGKLGQIDQRVIKSYYGPWCPIEHMARRQRMRVREFQNVLRRARWRVMGYLEAVE